MATSCKEDEAQNFFRLVSLLIENGSAVLRKFLMKHVTLAQASTGTLDKHLAINDSKLKRLQTKCILSKDQMRLLFPPPADVEKFDVTLLSCLLKNTCKLSNKEIEELDKLRTFRNEVYGHVPHASVEESIFKSLWTNITTVIREIANWSADPGYIQDNEKAMIRLETDCNFARPSLDILRQWYHEDQLMLSRLNSLEEQTQHLEEQNQQLVSRLKNIEKTAGIIKETESTEEEMEMNTYMYIQDEPDDVPQDDIHQEQQAKKMQNKALELLIESTETLLKAKTRPENMYVKTQLMQKARKMLEDKGNVVISGPPGEGKTFTGAMLMSLLFKKNQRLLLKNPRDWDHIDSAQTKIIFIDDMLGIYQFESARLADWNPVLDVIQSYLDVQKLKVIIGTRANILQECGSKLSRYKMFENVVHFSSAELSVKEKKDMLTVLLHYHKKSSKIDPSSIEDCVHTFTSPIGFPLCCELFCTDDSLLKRKAGFFKSPRKVFKKIDLLKKRKLVALILLFCKGGEMSASLLTDKKKKSKREQAPDDIADVEQILEEIVDSLPMKKEQPTRKQVKAILDEFHGIYVSFNKARNLYTFTHNVIYESIGLLFGKEDPETLLEVCDNNFLYQCVVVDSSDTTTTGAAATASSEQEYVVIPKEKFNVLAERFIKEVTKHNEITRTARHPAFLNANFVDDFIKELTEQKNTEIFYTSVQASSLTNNTFLQELVSIKSTVQTVDKMLHQIGACFHPSGDNQICWKCQQKERAVRECSLARELATFLILIIHGATASSDEIAGLLEKYSDDQVSSQIEELISKGRQIPQAASCFFIEACRMGFLKSIKFLLKWMKADSKWKPDEPWMEVAITYAYQANEVNIVELLINHNVIPSPNCLFLATQTQHRNLDLIKITIDSLKFSGRWDPINEDILNVVSAAFKHEQLDIMEILRAADVALPVKSFQWTVKNCDVSVVKKSIRSWKSTNQWDPEEKDMQEAVTEAFRACKHDIIECFLNEGFQLKPTHLCEAVKYGDVNLVKIAVNHLKSFGKWNFSDSVFATAMCDAYESNKEDMIELLYEEKVMLTPKCLYWAAQNQISQEPSLMKTTIQRLKSTAGWDPNHEDIEDAISEAFASFKEDIVQILASEGTTIPPNLFYWSVEQGCAALVQVTINHLKSVGKWYQGDIDRDQALLKAHICNQKDIITLLQVEGAKTSPKCLYWAAKHGDFPFVLDTIEAIKKAGKWDRDDGDIVKGLEKVQRYYKKHVLKDTPIGSMKDKRCFEQEMVRDINVDVKERRPSF